MGVPATADTVVATAAMAAAQATGGSQGSRQAGCRTIAHWPP